MATGDLCSLADIQLAYPDLTSNQIADAPGIITGISQEIAGRYPRAALSTTYDETVDPGINRTIKLAHFPVLAVHRVRADMSSVMQISRTGSARRASVEVLTTGEPGSQVVTGLSLVSEVAGVVTTASPLLFVTYLTLQALANAVNALGGWLANVVATNYTDMATLDLEPGQGPKACLTSTSPQTTAPAQLWAYTRDLNDYAIANAASGELTIYESVSDSYRYPDRTWGSDRRSTTMRITYDAGRSTAPPDVKRAAILIIGDLIQTQRFVGPVSYEKNQDYSVTMKTLQTMTFPPTAARILSRYKDRRIG